MFSSLLTVVLPGVPFVSYSPKTPNKTTNKSWKRNRAIGKAKPRSFLKEFDLRDPEDASFVSILFESGSSFSYPETTAKMQTRSLDLFTKNDTEHAGHR
jgi:hypothetical protein